MAEPIQSAAGVISLVALATSLFGPQAGPYVVILLASIGGGLWALSSAVLETRLAGLWLMIRCIVTAIALTSVIAGMVAAWLGTAPNEAIAVVAFVIGALGNKWIEIIDSIKVRITGLVQSGAKQ